MRQKHSLTALVALLIILIDSHAQKHFLHKNKSIINSNNNNNNINSSDNNNILPNIFVNNRDGELNENKGDVKRETAINTTLNKFNSISTKSNKIRDKKLVIARVDGSVFLFPSLVQRRKIIDGRYWQTNDPSQSELRLSRTHKDMEFFRLPREIVQKQQRQQQQQQQQYQQIIHDLTDINVYSQKRRNKKTKYVKSDENNKNKISFVIKENFSRMKNKINTTCVLCDESAIKYEISLRNVTSKNELNRVDEIRDKNSEENNKLKVLTEKKSRPLKNKVSVGHYELLSIDKGGERIVGKTTDTTLKVLLKVLTKFPSSPTYVKSETSLFNKESRGKDQAIQPKQVRQLPLNKEFPGIPVIIKTSESAKSNNEKYRSNYNKNNKPEDVTSPPFIIGQKINKKKKNPMKRVARELSPIELNGKTLSTNNINKQIFLKTVTSNISNDSLNLITTGITISEDHQNSLNISDQLEHYIKVTSPIETYNVSSIPTMTNPDSFDIHDYTPTSIIKLNPVLSNNSKISPAIKLYSGDYKLYAEDTSDNNSIPQETLNSTTENLTSQITTASLSDKKLLGVTEDSKLFLVGNSINPKLKWSMTMLNDNVGPVISALSNNQEELIINTDDHTSYSKTPIETPQTFETDEIPKISLKDTLQPNSHHHISNTTFTDNYGSHVISDEYRLSIPLLNSQPDVIQSETETVDVKTSLYNVSFNSRNIDNTTVKSRISNNSEVKNKKWEKVIKSNDHSLIGISDRMSNDTGNRVSLSTTENVVTIVHNDRRALGRSTDKQENTTRIQLNQWPVKHNAIVEGNLVLGGLMMVHEREDTVTCGPVMAQGGVQALEAMLYTLDWINKRDIVPGVKIGAHILDDCDKDTYGLEMAVDFIKGSISNIDGAEYNCNKTTVRKVISGVVGAASSVTSIQVANLLRLFRIPQITLTYKITYIKRVFDAIWTKEMK